jgi:Holliday junction resolvase RusA-like endonuclease
VTTMLPRKPLCSIWIEGQPISLQKKGNTEHYKEKIRTTASTVVPQPTKSPRIDVDILFSSKRSLRADVDNIIKPILDALKGVVYIDDNQVRSVRAIAFNTEDASSFIGPINIDDLDRIFREEPKEFLINVYHGLLIHSL